MENKSQTKKENQEKVICRKCLELKNKNEVQFYELKVVDYKVYRHYVQCKKECCKALSNIKYKELRKPHK